jgi:hypothetical protein
VLTAAAVAQAHGFAALDDVFYADETEFVAGRAGFGVGQELTMDQRVRHRCSIQNNGFVNDIITRKSVQLNGHSTNNINKLQVATTFAS